MTDIRELIKTEYKKCALSPTYFLRKYCYIQHSVRGRMLFDLYDYQEKAIDAFEEHDRIIVLKARQLGFSTSVAGYALHMALFYRDKNIVVIATKQETAKNIITKARFAYDNLPTWLRSKVIENNKLNIKFKNGSQIKAISSSGDAGRSEAVSLLIIDEAAFIENADEIWTSAQATLATGGRAIIISTPNGVGNFFHKTWEKTIEGENTFFPIKLTWREHPDRDEAWYEKEMQVYDERAFRQEYEAEFLGSGNTVYDADLVVARQQQYQIEPVHKSGFDGNLWIWDEPNYSKPYLVVADVSRGDGEDYSAFHVFEAHSCVQVAEYKGKIDTDNFGHMLVEISTKYNDAMLVIENATQGWATIQTVINRGYKNLFYMEEDPLVIEENRHITNKWNQRDKKKRPGFSTSSKNRPLIISKLGEYLRDDTVVIRSSRTYSELMTFIWQNGKAQAQAGYNDDLIMSLAIGLWVRDTSLRMHDLNMQLMKKGIESIQRTSPVYTANTLNHDPYLMPVAGRGTTSPFAASNDMEDTRWLLG